LIQIKQLSTYWGYNIAQIISFCSIWHYWDLFWNSRGNKSRFALIIFKTFHFRFSLSIDSFGFHCWKELPLVMHSTSVRWHWRRIYNIPYCVHHHWLVGVWMRLFKLLSFHSSFCCCLWALWSIRNCSHQRWDVWLRGNTSKEKKSLLFNKASFIWLKIQRKVIL